MDFSLHHFANREAVARTDEFELLKKSAKFADEHGFAAVWLPERHFHPFGGAYPNPAVAAAALAPITSRIRLRGGSVVLPLHDPLTVVEDWSMVDNLSAGRVDLAIASGWNADDFVLAPEQFAERRKKVVEQTAELRALWSGKAVPRVNGEGRAIEVTAFPPPWHDDLDLWMTCASNPDGFAEAGKAGMNVLTSLLQFTPADLREGVKRYRESREEAGIDPASGKFTVMMHAFVGETDERVRTLIHGPFSDYLVSSIDLWKAYVPDLRELPVASIVPVAFERYFRNSALFGSVGKCVDLISDLESMGVDELSCLIDFGVGQAHILEALCHLAEVKRLIQN
jgi:natural product biosynthesis luciferase-like monooxygenase protein